MLLSSGLKLSTAKLDCSEGNALLAVNLVFSPASRQVRLWVLALAPGSTVYQALDAGGVFLEFPDLLAMRLKIGIWGRKVGLDHLLIDKDRIEIYRPLRVDPQAARRERFSHQGAKTAGLFIANRPGSKVGY